MTLPCTVSETTILRPEVSASSCNTARVSISWKFSVSRCPSYSLVSENSVEPSCTSSVTGLTSIVNSLSDWYASCSYLPSAEMTIRVSRLVRSVSTVVTGVAKSITSRRRISSAGSPVSLKMATTRPPSWRMSTGVEGSVRLTTTRPPPSRVRRKSTLVIEREPPEAAKERSAATLLANWVVPAL